MGIFLPNSFGGAYRKSRDWSFPERRPGYSNPLIAELARTVRFCIHEYTPSHRRNADRAAGRSGIWVGTGARTGAARQDACGERYIFGRSNYLLSRIYDWRRRGRGGRNSCDIPILVLHAIREHTILVDDRGSGRVACHAGGLLADHPASESLLAARTKAGTHGIQIFFDRSEEVAWQRRSAARGLDVFARSLGTLTPSAGAVGDVKFDCDCSGGRNEISALPHALELGRQFMAGLIKTRPRQPCH
jgi:hypothetical protein